jgi:hypothetical protein
MQVLRKSPWAISAVALLAIVGAVVFGVSQTASATLTPKTVNANQGLPGTAPWNVEGVTQVIGTGTVPVPTAYLTNSGTVSVNASSYQHVELYVVCGTACQTAMNVNSMNINVVVGTNLPGTGFFPLGSFGFAPGNPPTISQPYDTPATNLQMYMYEGIGTGPPLGGASLQYAFVGRT